MCHRLCSFALSALQSEVTKRFRLMYSKSEICVRSGYTNFLYINEEPLDMQSLPGQTRNLRKALKAFQNNSHFNIARQREYYNTETEPCTEISYSDFFFLILNLSSESSKTMSADTSISK